MTQHTNQREIKFRGKRIDNGEWAYGSLLYGEIMYIYPTDAKLLTHDLKQVKPESVGQLTGLQDKNKKDVYEGDKTSDGVIEFNTETCCYIIRRANGTFIRLEVRKKDLEIIGNIYQS